MRARCDGVVAIIVGCVLCACARQHGEAADDANTTPSSAAMSGSAGKASSTQSAGSPDAAAKAEPASTDLPPDERGHVGAKAVVELAAVTTNTEDGRAGITGMGTFSETATGVDLDLQLHGCMFSETFSAFVQDGTNCDEATLTGPHWDSPRGEGLPEISCTGRSGGGHTYFTRYKREPKLWSIGTPASSNILGHALVIYEPGSLRPLACGVITRTADAEPTPQVVKDANYTSELRAVVGGLCLARMIVRDNTQSCPNPDELDECERAHCELDSCIAQCGEYLTCIQQSNEPACDSAYTCPIPQACADCQSRVVSCSFGFCVNALACAAPVMPGGPCSQLEACCAQQGDQATQCLESVHLLEKISGDPSCLGAMHDWDATAHYPVPCKFQ